MRLSEIIQRCRELGEEDPEVNCDSVVRAKCVADGVILAREIDEDLLEDELKKWLDDSVWATKEASMKHLRAILRAHRLT